MIGLFANAGEEDSDKRSITYVDELSDDEKELFLSEFKLPKVESVEFVNKEGRMAPPSLTDKKMAAYVIKDSEFNYSKRRVEFLSLFFITYMN